MADVSIHLDELLHNPLLTLSQLADVLDLSPAWLRGEALDGRIPCLNAGSSLRFDLGAVAQNLSSRAQRPAPLAAPPSLQEPAMPDVSIHLDEPLHRSLRLVQEALGRRQRRGKKVTQDEAIAQLIADGARRYLRARGGERAVQPSSVTAPKAAEEGAPAAPLASEPAPK